MADERFCGDAKCLLAVFKSDLVEFKEDIKADITKLNETQTKLVDMLAEQKGLYIQVTNLQYEFNRYRDTQDEINKDMNNKIGNVNDNVDEKLEQLVTSRELKFYLAGFGGAISIIVFLLDYFVK